VATIKIPKKTKPVPKPKRKPGTRAGLTKSLIAATAVKQIDSAGMGEFSIRKLASAMGVVGPTSIHAHFKGGTEANSKAVAAQALAGTTRPFKPKEEPAEYLRELLLKMLEALHARTVVAHLVVFSLSSDPILHPLLAKRLLLTLAEYMYKSCLGPGSVPIFGTYFAKSPRGVFDLNTTKSSSDPLPLSTGSISNSNFLPL
jgi:hypothetical protein